LDEVGKLCLIVLSSTRWVGSVEDSEGRGWRVEKGGGRRVEGGEGQRKKGGGLSIECNDCQPSLRLLAA